jgi:uncharacterized protein (TIGR02611 family)
VPVHPTAGKPRVPMPDEPDPTPSTPTKPSRAEPDTPDEQASRTRLRHLLARLRAHPTGRILLRAGVGIAGAVVVIVGIILLPLPGPGLAIIFLGLAVWAIEFHWARRLLLYAKTRLLQWRAWYARRSWPARIAVGAGTAVVVLAIVGLALWLSAGPLIWRTLRN